MSATPDAGVVDGAAGRLSEAVPRALPIPVYGDPKDYVSKVARHSGSSFLLPMLLLPREKREAMLALYAFCRETDDVADEVPDQTEALALLNAWREEIAALYRGEPHHPVTIALAQPVERFGLAQKHFLGILDGFHMDRGAAMLRPTLAELERYCHCVASCVGLLSVEIFGYRSPRIPEFAEHLGQAFQLTNILRDVREDAERGRIYLPIELLKRERVDHLTPMDLLKSDGAQRICAEIGAMARKRFALADQALPAEERRAMRSALLMRGIYEAYLDRIEARGFRLDLPRVRFGAGRKLLLVLRALVRTF
ncbi:MAG: presqualene diphosphate synthase HpnD [Alphaproteobacteria bacterium]|nr:presqualene diphosphate synthase HpnD [Alphaproteobacteria bacterium]